MPFVDFPETVPPHIRMEFWRGTGVQIVEIQVAANFSPALMKDYVCYYHEDRKHLALAKGTPAGREAEKNPEVGYSVISMPRLGGLHHRYDLAA